MPSIGQAPDWIDAQRRAGIDREVARRVEAGTTLDVAGYGPILIPGDERTRGFIVNLKDVAKERVQAGDTVTPIPFRDPDDTIHDLTPQQFISLWLAGVSWVQSIYSASWALKDNPPIPADYADDGYWP